MAQPAHPHPSLQTLSSAARAPDPRTRRAAATSPPAAHRAARRHSAPPRSPPPQRLRGRHPPPARASACAAALAPHAAAAPRHQPIPWPPAAPARPLVLVLFPAPAAGYGGFLQVRALQDRRQGGLPRHVPLLRHGESPPAAPGWVTHIPMLPPFPLHL